MALAGRSVKVNINRCSWLLGTLANLRALMIPMCVGAYCICSSGQNAGIRCVSAVPEFLNGRFVNEFSSSGFWEGVSHWHHAPPSKLKLMKQFSSCLQFTIDYNVWKWMEKPFLIISVPHEWYICFHIFSFYHCIMKITVCNCALGLI